METLGEIMREELQLLLHMLSDGLRREVIQRQNWSRLLPDKKYDMSITGEREIGLASSLYAQLRSAGYIVQVESYIEGGNNIRRPDFCIWLPMSKKFIYLELKLCAWGRNDQYRYDYTIGEIKKLNDDKELINHPHGLVCIGFSKETERQNKQLLEKFEKHLSQEIAKGYQFYEEIGRNCVDFLGMDNKTIYAVVGLWVRKEWGDV